MVNRESVDLLRQELSSCKESMDALTERLSEIEERLADASSRLGDLGERAEASVESAQAAADEIVEQCSEEGRVREWLSEAAEALEELAEEAREGISERFTEAADAIDAAAGRVASEIVQTVDSLRDKARSTIAAATERRSVRFNGIERRLDEMMERLDQLRERFEGLGSEFTDVRAVLEEGFQDASAGVDGVREALMETREAIQSLTGVA
ncbi:hypothetical protein OS176_02525 [Xanthomonadaceae bacterium XH05]|nr:hypothetical protein [Xanthomonadaceae bacterium XH05]